MSTQPLNTPAIEARLAAANKELIHICKDPAKNFVMRVPVKDYDSDRVLSAALDDTQALLDEVRELRELVKDAYWEGHRECWRHVSPKHLDGMIESRASAWTLSTARARLEGRTP
jgi:hypothetical protein